MERLRYIFLWRSTYGLLPTPANLNSSCSWYDDQSDSRCACGRKENLRLQHILSSCPSSLFWPAHMVLQQCSQSGCTVDAVWGSICRRPMLLLNVRPCIHRMSTCAMWPCALLFAWPVVQPCLNDYSLNLNKSWKLLTGYWGMHMEQGHTEQANILWIRGVIYHLEGVLSLPAMGGTQLRILLVSIRHKTINIFNHLCFEILK